MENSKTLSQTILQSIDPKSLSESGMSTTLSNSSNNFSSSPSTVSSTGSSSGFFNSLKSINMTTWLLIILILAFLGFNIFAYLAKSTDIITEILNPLLKKLFGITIGVTSQTVDVSAEGAKAVVSETSNAIESGLTNIQNITPTGANSSVKGQPIEQDDNTKAQSDQSTLNKALNSAQQSNQNQQEYQANEATSSLNYSGKSGWCYVGDDKGFRTCAEVGRNDTCMSGDIFPSQEICMNPNLRM